jgi:fructose-bisphosphate aldolase, class II
MDSALAIVRAAEAEGLPVIMQAGKPECDYAGGVKNLAQIAKMAAADCLQDVALHLDHSETVDLCKEAIDAGFGSVMIDGSHLDYEKNIEITLKVVEIASKTGVAVEGELGKIGGTEGTVTGGDDEGLTDPAQVVDFVKKTGIDILAIGIGTVHGFFTKPLKINVQRLKEIAAVTELPLVLHGGSGVSEEIIREVIKEGISKINICTEVIAAMGQAISRAQETDGFKYSVNSLFRPGYEAALKVISGRIRMFNPRK